MKIKDFRHFFKLGEKSSANLPENSVDYKGNLSFKANPAEANQLNS